MKAKSSSIALLINLHIFGPQVGNAAIPCHKIATNVRKLTFFFNVESGKINTNYLDANDDPHSLGYARKVKFYPGARFVQSLEIDNFRFFFSETLSDYGGYAELLSTAEIISTESSCREYNN